jgi:energy-coupling factor transport system ATP-binding protein
MQAMSMLHDIIREWKGQGKTIIISEHRLWYLKDIADRVIYMDKGRIAREWSGKEFAELSEIETKSLKLRPTSIMIMQQTTVEYTVM